MNMKSSFSQDDLLFFMSEEKEGSKLPSKNMAMFDRIIEVNSTGGRYGKGEIIAEFDINPSKWFFACHFPGDPVMPGCLGLDALWQISGFFLSWSGHVGKGRALGSDQVRFFGEIIPSTKLVRYHIHVRRIIKKDMTMIVTDGDVYADNKHIYSAEKLRVAFLPTERGL
jgi:3-hydroxyacyl-[acyl-carrier protein] dehydratase/trans-2-decenoyl-[acyl-carrier protein] isomerase